MIFNNELNISLIKLYVFKHLIVCSVLALSNTTNLAIQTFIIKLNVPQDWFYSNSCLSVGFIVIYDYITVLFVRSEGVLLNAFHLER